MSKLPPPPEPPKSETQEVMDGAKQNVKDTGDKVSKATETLKDFASGKANVVDAALAVKGAVDAVKGLSGKLSESAMMPVMKKLAAFKGKAVLPAGKQMDPVMGIDVHMVTIPPSPAPVPMPHPYIGMLFNPKDWVSCLVNTFKKQALDAVPAPKEGTTGVGASLAKNKDAIAGIAMGLAGLSASVKFGGFVPRAVTGTKTKNIPHIPMGAGFHPGFAASVAKNHGKAFLGSLFVAADGDPMVGSFHLNYDCWDVGVVDLFKGQRAGAKKKPEPGGALAELYVPSGTVMPIPLGKPVLVNSIPTPINPLAILNHLFKAGLGKLAKAGRKLAQKGLNKLTGKVGCGALTKVSKLIGTGQSHPVDVAEGHFYTDNVDFTLPGPVPFGFERTWYSYSNYKGPLGYGWHHSYDMALAIDEAEGMAALRMSDGRVTGFKLPVNAQGTFNRSEKLTLTRHEDGYYYVTDSRGLVYRFTQQLYRNPYNKTEIHLLQSIANRNGFAIRFTYNEDGLLTRILDSAGRKLNIFNDDNGRIIRIDAPHPDIKGQSFPIARYKYSDEGDMIEHLDALDQPMRYEYSRHLMMKEVWRNGCNWHFRYDRKEGIEAKCVEVWGDGDLLHYTFDYSSPLYTEVINSLGHKKVFYHKNGLVIKYIDPNGQPWTYRYNRFNELEKESDPLGNEIFYAYDEFGHVVSRTNPDGGFMVFNYQKIANHFVITETVAFDGGKWKWEYDESANMTAMINPLGGKTAYQYEDGLLVKILTNRGRVDELRYDDFLNIVSFSTSNGAVSSYSFDFLGNCRSITNHAGAVQHRKHDLLSRLIAVNDFDGNVISLKYDPIDNVVFFKERTRSMSYTYNGMWKLTSRTDRRSTVFYEYDTELRLRKIVNQHGETFNFELDGCGRLIREKGFDDTILSYDRNPAGWVTRLNRPGKKFTAYQHDNCGRVIGVEYSDGAFQKFRYQPNGNLVHASNDLCQLNFACDAMGNTLSEKMDGYEVSSVFNAACDRINVSSSVGADLHFDYDHSGRSINIAAGLHEISIGRDQAGSEMSRKLPGDISSIWTRDNIGRPVSHTTVFLGAGHHGPSHRRQYKWDTNIMLKELSEDGRPTTFHYDELSMLAKSVYPEGGVQYRQPDKAGNLYQSDDQTDRLYGKGGKLIRSSRHLFTYDAEGNTIEKKDKKGNRWRYTWDDIGQLSKVELPDGLVVTFGYDPCGRRIWKRCKNTFTRYLWDGNNLLHEWKENATTGDKLSDISIADNGMITWIFDPKASTLAARIKGEKFYGVITDHLGTPTQMYSDDGYLIWKGTLDSYGQLNLETGERSTCPHRYRGQYEDRETGLYYNRFRYYQPEDGRYLTKDPIGLEGGMELYNYVDDPNSEIDELGLSDSSILGDNLGDPPGDNHDAHHIVMAGSKDEKMVKLREKMELMGIDKNSKENGIWLPNTADDRESGSRTAHKGEGVHSDAYKQHVYDRLKNCTTDIEFLAELAKIKAQLMRGKTFPCKK